MYSMILARESGDEYSIRSCKIHCENPVFQRSIDLVAILGFSCRNRHIRLFTLFASFSVISYFVPRTSLTVKELYL